MESHYRIWPLFIVLIVLLIAVAGIVQPTVLSRFTYAAEKGRLQAEREEIANAPVSDEFSGALRDLSRAFRMAAGHVRPAVVNIDTRSVSSFRERIENLPESLRRHLEEQLGDQLDEGDLDDLNTEFGRGSGMVVDAQGGFILTNNHVIEGADEIAVTLSDGRRRDAEVITVDTKTDLALLRIDADRLHQVVFGNSDEVEVGDFVLAIGSPLGYRQSVSHGIVSAKGRDQAILEYSNFIQTDAAINPGNSGGPLINLRGEVVGMNTAIATRTGMDNGIGFAIPARQIKAVLPYMLAGEEIERGYLGVVIRGVRDEREVAESFGWPEPYGVLIDQEPLSGGPADRAGLRRGDIIVGIDGRQMGWAADLQETVAATRPGTTVEMEVWRDERLQTLRVRVGKQPEGFSTRQRFVPSRMPEADEDDTEIAGVEIPELGMIVATLDSHLAGRHGWQDEPRGVVVIEVEPDGPAEAALLRVGDLIVEVQRDEVFSATQFRRAVRRSLADGDEVRVYMKRTPEMSAYRVIRPD
ncbi:MAG: trypsin-like peptidase domain-containing protein [Phycisphaerales bacterium]|nr:MAG: trypsin-like peptidase domain-containing protein [Phycisphaerales bacterium]